MKPYFEAEGVTLYHGDCREALAALEAASLAALVTDPPAGIGFMGKEWDRDKGGREPWVAWLAGILGECRRVLKPGAHALVWALPRTSHWTATAIEDAGFEIRDVITHHYGTGFPKSLDVSKAIDKAAGAEREVVGDNPNHRAVSGVEYAGVYAGGNTGAATITAPATDAAKRWFGWGTALKPASEHWILARVPVEGTIAATVEKHGTGAINIDACRIGIGEGGERDGEASAKRRYVSSGGTNFAATPGPRGGSSLGRWPTNLLLSHSQDAWYTLHNDTPEEVRREILAYYRAVEAMPTLRSAIQGQSVSAGAEEVLLAGVRGSEPEGGAQAGVGETDVRGVRPRVRGPSGVGQERTTALLFESVPYGGSRMGQTEGDAAVGGDAPEDEGRGNGEVSQGEFVAVEGRQVQGPVGIHPCNDCHHAGEPAPTGGSDDDEGVHLGASGGRGDEAWPTARRRGDSSPSERREGGQQTGESSGGREGGALRGAQARGTGASAPARARDEAGGGEPDIEVELEGIPPEWLKHFRVSRTVGCVEVGTRRVRTNDPGITHEKVAGWGYSGERRNVGHADADGREEVPLWACVPGCPVRAMDEQSGERSYNPGGVFASGQPGGWPGGKRAVFGYGDTGGASRFFPTFPGEPFLYVPKAARAERDAGLESLPARTGGEATGREDGSAGTESPRAGAGRTGGARNAHPTVKPVALMRWLVRLITPPGGTVLDPFLGSGTTAVAALLEGRSVVGVEREAEWCEVARLRCEHAREEFRMEAPLFRSEAPAEVPA